MGHSLDILLILSMAIMSFGTKVNVVHKWKHCEFEFESKEQEEDVINSGTYNISKCIFSDVNKANDGRVFITAPKVLGPDLPATLGTITNKTGPGGPLVRPYPDWSWYNSSCMCDGIFNVHRTHIQCNHLFVLDSGTVGYDQICNPKLLIFNLEDDTLVKTIYIPLDIATNQTGSGLLIKPYVHVPGNCKQFLDKMIVFIADTQGAAIVVYDSSTKRMCRVESDYMKPIDATIFIGNESFTYPNGIYDMTILHNELYYAVATGKKIYKIKIETLLKCPNKKTANKQTKLVINIPSQTAVITSAGRSIFYSETQAMSIRGTNVSKKPGKNTVVLAQDDYIFQSVSSLKAVIHWDQMTGFSNKYQRFASNTLNLNETNFHYFEMNLSKILKKMELLKI